DVGAQHRLGELERLARSAPDVGDQRAPEVPAGHAHPPESAEMNRTLSPSASGASGSLLMRSPLTAATTWPLSSSSAAAAAPASVAARAGSGARAPGGRSTPKRSMSTA